MMPEERIRAVERLGFTTRQARFLVTVMRHSGVCVPRQYATFAGIAYGHKTNRLFAGLVEERIASTCLCMHNRGFVYHVHHRGLYGAIGEPQSRFRRPVPAAAIVPRLMLLDAVLEGPAMTWLAGEADKIRHFTGPGIAVDHLPHQGARTGLGGTSRLFPDALPIGVDQLNRAVFLFPATRSSVADVRPFLRRHLAILAALSAWTIRLLFAQDERAAAVALQGIVERELESVLRPPHQPERRVERQALGHRYGHLSPLVAPRAQSSFGVEKGERVGERLAARSQPPLARSRHKHRDVLQRPSLRAPMTNNYWPCLM